MRLSERTGSGSVHPSVEDEKEESVSPDPETDVVRYASVESSFTNG
jgi:hypothetical protein